MNMRDVLKVVAVAFVTGFGGGFLWGVMDHRSEESIKQFARTHISLPDPQQGLLIFSCGPDKLMAYDLLSDRVLKDREQIKTRLKSNSNAILTSGLFKHSTIVAAEGFGAYFNLRDEIKSFKDETKLVPDKLLAILVALAPGGYLGYVSSGWFQLECSSQLLYDRLADKKVWIESRIDAAKFLFERLPYCIDRNLTLPDSAVRHQQFDSIDLTSSVGDRRDQTTRTPQQNSTIWRQTIAQVNALPDSALIAARYIRANLPALSDRTGPPTWGDSIYQRLYGEKEFGFTSSDVDFDKTDFQALIEVSRRCSQIDERMTKSLYQNAGLSKQSY